MNKKKTGAKPEKNENPWKRMMERVKSEFTTEEVFLQNEKKANLLMARCLLVAAAMMCVFWVLNLAGVLDVGREFIVPLLVGGFTVLIIPAVVCFIFKGEKQWLKYLMMLCLIVATAYTDRLLTFNVALLIILPVVLSCRYYSCKFTVLTGVLTTVAFALSAYFGARYVVGMQDMNFASEDIAVYVRDVMQLSFLPKWMLFLLVSSVCFAIARYGRGMVLAQDKIARQSARVETELEMAGMIQAQALPDTSSLPTGSVRSFDLSAMMIPAKEVGGDFYDFISLDDDHLALIVADVSDKGIAASLYMMLSKTLLDSKLTTCRSPGAVLEDVNEQLCAKSMKGTFVTVWLGILDLRTGDLVTANAGHEYPAIRRRDGQFALIKDKHGFVLGGAGMMRYRETKLHLDEGDTLFVYTDGVPEANSPEGELYGMKRMLSSLDSHSGGSMKELIDGVKSDLDAFAAEAPQFDDTTMLALRLTGPAAPRTLEIPASVEHIEEAQEWIARGIDRYMPTDRERKRLAVAADEILSNIARYGQASGVLLLLEGESDRVKLTFSDDGTPFNPLIAPEPDPTADLSQRGIGGWGIFIAKKFTDALAYEYKDGRNCLTVTKIFASPKGE